VAGLPLKRLLKRVCCPGYPRYSIDGLTVSNADKAAKKAAVSTPAPNQGEHISEMEPTLISQGSRFRPELTALAFELTGKAAGFRRSLPNRVSVALAELVRSMDCYYSNLIEGHNTHPVEIERALKGEYSNNLEKRNLQLEAKAHIAVQKWIDDGSLRGQATTRHGICEMHRRFCTELPKELLWVEDPATHEHLPVVPGEFRRNHVKGGRLVPVSPGAVPRFMERFESVYTGLDKVESVLAAAVAHHRLAWIHPFLDGNGGSLGSCLTRRCSKRSTPERFGLLLVVWRKELRHTRNFWRIVTEHAAMNWMGEEI
jgi:hypothetical protein